MSFPAVAVLVLAASTATLARCPNTPRVSCEKTPWRSLDGSCNNRDDPTRGMANTPLIRILPAAYADGVHAPRRSASNRTLPSARRLVTALLPDKNVPSDHSNILTMTWAQLVSHDGSRIQAPFPRANSRCCGAAEPTDFCDRIPVPDDDFFFAKHDVQCFGVDRAAAAPCHGAAHEQNNLVTHYQDASFVYGSGAAVASRLRERRGGRLRTEVIMGNEFLPGLQAGDARVTITPMLASLQTLFVREHNRLCRILGALNVLWDDERLYQEARKIVIAQWQLISYRDWLPKIIGKAAVLSNGLLPSLGRHSQDYDVAVDASTANDFTSAAYRTFHSMVADDTWFGGGGGEPLATPLPLSSVPAEAVQSPRNLRRSVLGCVFQPRQEQDQFMAGEITNKMFAGGAEFGGDLLSTDIQRGRDHGLPGYNEYRGLCENLTKATTWDDFADTISADNIEVLRSLYEHPDDVDAFVGGVLEQRRDSSPTATVSSPVFQCILVNQFVRWKRGDRLFFDNPGVFSLDQLRALGAQSFSRLVCDNVPGVSRLPRDAFSRVRTPGNEEVPCSSLPGVNYSPWRVSRRG